MMRPQPIIISILISIIAAQTPLIAFFNYTICKKEIPEFSGKKTYPFNSLNELKTLDNLKKFGLSAPNETDHQKGKALILLALQANANKHSDWALAHGLLGTSMLKASSIEKAAYKSFFMSLNNYNYYKMNENQSLMFLFDDIINAINKTNSLIVKRELVIMSISRYIHNRFTYNTSGDSKPIYTPEKNRKIHPQLKKMLDIGINVYSDFEDKEVDDQNLLSILGIAYAVLQFDNVTLKDIDLRYLEPVKIYNDTLKIALDTLIKRPTHGYKFLVILNSKMERKKLPVKDIMLFTTNKTSKQLIKTLIENDIHTLAISSDETPKTSFIPKKNQIKETSPKKTKKAPQQALDQSIQENETPQESPQPLELDTQENETAQESPQPLERNTQENETTQESPQPLERDTQENETTQESPQPLERDTQENETAQESPQPLELDTQEKSSEKETQDDDIFAEDRFR